MQKRIGPKENETLTSIIKIIKRYAIFKQDKKKRETYFNNLLRTHIAQTESRVTNQSIHCATLIGQRFRPEFCLKGSKGIPLLCVECKKLTDSTAKQRLKDGLSQALVYSTEYKCVLLVFYDYSKNASLTQCFATNNSPEHEFADSLWKHHRIKIIFIAAR